MNLLFRVVDLKLFLTTSNGFSRPAKMIRHLLITLPGTSKLGFEPPILRFNLCKKITSLPNAIKYAQRDLKRGRCHKQILA